MELQRQYWSGDPNEGEIGTLSGPGSREKVPQGPIISPVKETRKLLTAVNEQFPSQSGET